MLCTKPLILLRVIVFSWKLTSIAGFSLRDFPASQFLPVASHFGTKSSTSPRIPTHLQTSNNENHDPSQENEAIRSSKIFGVTLKLAVDRNGGVAELDTTESERFTSPESLDMVHRLRRDSDAVLIGRGTVQADNPSLTVRRVEPRPNKLQIPQQEQQPSMQPLRVILDPQFVLGLEQFSSEESYQIFEDGLPTAVYHTLEDVDIESLAILDTVDFIKLPALSAEQNERLLTVPSSEAISMQSSTDQPEEANDNGSAQKLLSVASVLSELSQRYNVQHLMVEGGPVTAQSFLRAGLVDRALIVKAPVAFRQPLDSGIRPEILQAAGLELVGTYSSGADEIDCWSRPHLDWPTDELQNWP